MSNDNARYKQSYISVSLQWATTVPNINNVTFKTTWNKGFKNKQIFSQEKDKYPMTIILTVNYKLPM